MLPGFAEKGAAVPVPDAAIAAPPPVPKPSRPAPKPARPPSPAAKRYERGRFQVGLRLDEERHNALRLIAFERRVAMQVIFDELLEEFLTKVRKGQG